jgi:hypothetical protein
LSHSYLIRTSKSDREGSKHTFCSDKNEFEDGMIRMTSVCMQFDSFFARIGPESLKAAMGLELLPKAPMGGVGFILPL